MTYDRILIVTDNHSLFRRFKLLLNELKLNNELFDFCCTSKAFEIEEENFRKINIKKEYPELIDKYDLIISLHCKQIFPKELVTSVKCINVHPGFNPYNRGWYPQVFSILNKLPIGATIHEMDEQIDHGKIIDQKKVDINSWDTSLEVYNRVLDIEIELLRNNLLNILSNTYLSYEPESEGNYNGIKDFQSLLNLDLNETTKVGDFLDRLRALTHGSYNNAYFIDPATGQKIFVKIQFFKDE